MNEKDIILADLGILISNVLDKNVKHVKYENRVIWGRKLSDLKNKLDRLL